MSTKILFAAITIMLGVSFAPPLGADEPIIPPSISKVWPAGMERGSTATFTLDGRNLSDAKEVVFDAPGISGKVTQIADVPENITGPRVGVDTSAQVPLGKKQTAKLEVTVAKDAAPGIHWFRVQTPLGSSNLVAFDIGELPEIEAKEANTEQAQTVELPATLVGAIAWPGRVDAYQFQGKAGEELVFETVASELGSQLRSILSLRDSNGKILAHAGEYQRRSDGVLTAKLPSGGTYTVSITHLQKRGCGGFFYRLNAWPLPFGTGMFPLGGFFG